MNWSKAFKLMMQGNKIKLPSWEGYWYWDEDLLTIMMHCKDNTKIDVRDTQRVAYTFENIASDDWIIATKDNTPILGGTATFDFTTALKYLDRGLKLRRITWTNGDYIEKNSFHIDIEVIYYNHTNLNLKSHWTPIFSDLTSKDWTFA